MSRNGSGVFSLAAGNPVSTGSTISSTWANNTLSDIATQLTNSVAADGQTTMSGNLKMGNQKVTGMANGTTTGDALSWAQLFAQGAPATLASAGTVDIGAATTVAVEISGTTTITSFGTNYNGPRFLRFTGALILTHNSTTLNLPGAANITTVAGDTCIVYPNSSSNGWNVVSYQQSSYAPSYFMPVVLRSYLSGCTLSTAGSSATMSIAAGQAVDSTNSVTMSLAAMSKTTSAWTVGDAQGGLDTGSIANSTWYYFYVIRRPDTGVVDVVFSTSSSAPTLPTNYTQYRYIGAGLTNGSAQWTKFTQFGDDFFWDSPVLDFSSAGSATAANLTLSVPRGRKMKAVMNIAPTSNQGVYVSDPANSDLAPSLTASPLAQSYLGSASSVANGSVLCWTNTSAQIRHREVGTGTIYIATVGWTDLRGKDL